jgi:hypothetical protein
MRTCAMPGAASTYVSVGAPAGSPPLRSDRRKRPRLGVHWPLRFRGDPVETVTEDLSSDGFYFRSPRAFLPGEVRVCTLIAPTCHPDERTRHILIECCVRVVRVEALTAAVLYGVGCRILDYRVVAGSSESTAACDVAEEAGRSVFLTSFVEPV